MRKQEIPLIFLILKITAMMSPENYCRIIVVEFMLTSFLVADLNLFKTKTRTNRKNHLGLKHGHEQDFI